MGLINTASWSNRIITTGLTISYSINPVEGEWNYQSTFAELQYLYEAWQYHRYATMQYKYVGMSESAAKAKASSVRGSLTRIYYISRWQNDGQFHTQVGGTKLQGTVEVVKNIGHLYDVVVTINEHDTRMRVEADQNPESVFALENTRQYLF